MVLNYIWIGFFVVAFIIALIKVIFLGDTEIFTAIMNSTFDSSKTAFEISLGLTGVLALWLGIMKVGENSGLINALARFLSPVLCRLFPDIPKGHPVLGSIFMNMSANMLGLDNAATPLGLKAMKELQELNPKKDTASNPMIMFLVINTSGLIIIPISIMVYRAQMGAAQPTDVFIPILLSTFISTLVGVIAVSIAQKINLINKPILILMGIICLFFSGLIYLFLSVSREDMGTYSTLIANILLFSVIILFILTGVRKKINVYDSFVEGAKEGFTMNYEDDELQKFGEKTAAQVLYFSSARKLEKGIYLDGTKIICAADVPVELCDVSELKILGTHNYENVMAASAMAYAYGVPIEVIRKNLLTFPGVEHRIEFVAEKRGVLYYNDSKGTNPDVSWRWMRHPVSGRAAGRANICFRRVANTSPPRS